MATILIEQLYEISTNINKELKIAHSPRLMLQLARTSKFGLDNFPEAFRILISKFRHHLITGHPLNSRKISTGRVIPLLFQSMDETLVQLTRNAPAYLQNLHSFQDAPPLLRLSAITRPSEAHQQTPKTRRVLLPTPSLPPRGFVPLEDFMRELSIVPPNQRSTNLPEARRERPKLLTKQTKKTKIPIEKKK